MSLRSVLTRVAIAGAAGAMVGAVLVTPAVADDEWGGDPQASSQDSQDSQDFQASQAAQFEGGGGGDGREEWEGHGGHGDPRTTRGVVTASTLLLRSAPNRGSQVIRTAHRGEVVNIFCKTQGQSVNGDRRWFLLTDGTWAWGSAFYIRTLGAEPRWC
ncbi:SH3 domain-containing protein [Streptomyces griseosporeus]|uniref:SH3 domain-containing protein n=1 Tax=Streptomyces griseosporeus TaxID=1910 RepID=UPI0036FA4FA4